MLLRAAGVGTDDELLLIAPGAAWETKRWPAERFAEVACALVPGTLARVVVVGTAGDRAHAATIAAALAQSGAPPVVDLTGRTTTAELVAALARATLLLANDSAPGHVAAALGRPVLALFGPTVPAQGFAPIGPRVHIAQRALSCRPCSRHGGAFCPIGTHECLAGLPAAVVIAAAQGLLRSRRAAAGCRERGLMARELVIVSFAGAGSAIEVPAALGAVRVVAAHEHASAAALAQAADVAHADVLWLPPWTELAPEVVAAIVAWRAAAARGAAARGPRAPRAALRGHRDRARDAAPGALVARRGRARAAICRDRARTRTSSISRRRGRWRCPAICAPTSRRSTCRPRRRRACATRRVGSRRGARCC